MVAHMQMTRQRGQWVEVAWYLGTDKAEFLDGRFLCGLAEVVKLPGCVRLIGDSRAQPFGYPRVFVLIAGSDAPMAVWARLVCRPSTFAKGLVVEHASLARPNLSGWHHRARATADRLSSKAGCYVDATSP